MNQRQGKMKVKILSMVLICSILIQLIIPLISLGASINTSMSSKATQLKAGDTVYVDLYVTGDAISGYSGYLDYDTTVFSELKKSNLILPDDLQDAGYGDWSASYTTSTKKIVLLESNGDYYTIPNNGLLLQIELTVIKDTETTDVSLNAIEIDGNNAYYSDNINISTTLPKQVTNYTITYNANTTDSVTGMPSNGKKPEGDTYTIEAGPTRANYTFTGWNTEPDGTGTPYPAGTTYSTDANLELYAQWEIVKSTLTVNPNGGVWEGSSASQAFTQGYGTTKTINNPTSTPNGNIVKFNANGGTTTKGQETQTTTFSGWTGATLNGTTYTFGLNNATLTANYTGNSIELPTATKTGSTFKGWSTDIEGNNIIGGAGDPYTPTYTTSNAVITLFAQYQEDTYTLTINPNGGTLNGSTSNSSVTGKYNEAKEITTPTAPDGYTITLNNEGTTTTQVQTTTFKQWNVISGDGTISGTTYTFGTQDGEIQAEYESNSVTLPTPTRTGYTFNGWYTQATGGTKVTSPYMPTSNITLYAHWTANTYTITFDPGQGTVNPTSMTVTYDQTYGTLPTPTRPGYDFNGWKNNNQTVTSTDTVKITQNTTLTAEWLGAEYTVTFNYDGGTPATPATKTVRNEGTYGDLPTPTKTGYTFNGWYNSANTKIESTTTVNLTANETLTAKWTPIQSTLTVDPVGGTYDGNTTAQQFTENYGTTKEINDPVAPNANIITFNSNGGTQVTPLTQTTTFSGWTGATLSGRTYTFGLNNETLTANYTANSITLPNVTKTGATFLGWSTDEEGNNIIGVVGDTYTPAYTTPNASITLYAQYEEETYTLTVNPNGGTYNGSTESTTITGTYNSSKTITTPIAPNGYTVTLNNEGTTKDITQTKTFTGWTKTSGEGTLNTEGTEFTFGESDATIVASYTENSIDLSTEQPTRTGYTFEGWYTQLAGGTKIESPYMPTSDITLYAHWTANTYTITFDPGTDGTVNPTSMTVTYDQTYGTLPTPTRPGFDFDGWEDENGNLVTEDDTVKITGNTTLTARWLGATYTVTFDYNGGTPTTPTSKTVRNEGKYGELPTPTKTGYTLKGWFNSNDQKIESTTTVNLTADETLTAKWEANTYTITFESGEGTLNPSETTKQVAYGQPYGTLPTPTRPGYRFNGWINENGEKVTENDIVDITETTTLTATWEGEEYTLTFNYDGGNGDTTSKIIKNGEPYGQLPNSAKTGYTFKGWFDSNDQEITSTTIVNVTSNTELKAKYEINKYIVTFKNDDGTVLATIPANHGTSIVYTGDKPVKSNVLAGYEATFTGWDNEAELQNITNDMTLTATYTISPIVYTITYKNLKDSDNSANPATYTIEDSNITLVDLPNQGKYIFKGWYTSNDETGTKVTSIDTSKLGNIILHAQWENDSLYFKSAKYKIGENDIDNYEDGDIYLDKIEPETTVSELINNCDTNGTITVIDDNGQTLSSTDLVGTTMTIKVTRYDEEIVMTIVVMGDIDGDGKATVQDLSELNKAYLGITEVELTGARFKAADIDDSKKITATDFSELNRASLGTSKLTYNKPNKQ